MSTYRCLNEGFSSIGGEGFPNTHWPGIAQACQTDEAQRQTALGDLLSRYYTPLKTHLIRFYNVSEDQAADWLQGFIMKKVLLQNVVSQVDAARGKFRTFMLHALHNFVIQEIRYNRTGKRSAPGVSIPIDELPENEVPSDDQPQQVSIDQAWARSILAKAIQRMEQECMSTGRQETWGVFEHRILRPLLESTEPLDYARLIERFNFKSPTQAFNALITGKRTFARILRAVIAEYAKNDQEIEAEICDLKRILIKN
jgi:DNA-directed RNA polymerase specialized sigma24 family protein